MEASKIGYWLQLLSNIGILLGLVLVGFQMKQNADLLRVQLLYEESDRFSSGERSLIGEDGASVLSKSLTDPTGLTLAERRVVDIHLYSTVEQWYAGYRLSVQGLVDEADWKHRIQREAEYLLGNPYGLAWWKTYSQLSTLPEDFINAVHAEIAPLDGVNFTLLFDQLIQDELGRLTEKTTENRTTN